MLVLAPVVVTMALAGLWIARRDDPATRRGRLVPESGALFGAWMERDTTTGSGFRTMITDREAQIGRRFDIVNHFYPFSAVFPGQHETWDIEMGRIPMISWNGTSTTAIGRGDHDALIRTRARAVAALGAPVFMRWFWEMDGAKVAIAGTPAEYVAAWRRVRALFADEGATNAVWTWCPTAWGFEQGDADAWYPGDDEVEWICADGYNWAPTMDGARWRDWTAIYADAHAFAEAHDKPLMAGEWGALEREPGEKAAWYDDAREAIKAMPQIAAVVVFDELRWRTDVRRWFDWRVDSTEATLAAFRRWAQDPYFAA